jgi:hypothetical protein
MSKPKASIIFTQTSNPANRWNQAISDAEQMIQEAKAKIARLRQSIRTFEELRNSGAPFPGESANQPEKDGQ